MSEAAIVKSILRALNALPSTRAVKRHGSAMGRRGTPDIDGCYNGLAFYLEVKRPGKTPTPLQAYELRQWAAAGAITACVTSAQEAVDVVTS